MTAKRESVRKRKKEALAAHPKFADANGGEEHAPILRVKREPRWRIIREAFPKEERLHSLAGEDRGCVRQVYRGTTAPACGEDATICTYCEEESMSLKTGKYTLRHARLRLGRSKTLEFKC